MIGEETEGVGSESFPVPDEQQIPPIETDEQPVGQNGTDEEAETEGEPEAQAEEKPKGKSVQERIDEITAARREAERDAEYWRSRALNKEPEQQPEQSDGRPNPDSYEFGDADPAYDEALIDWKARQIAEQIVDRKLGELTQRQEVAQQIRELETNYSQRLEAVREELPDYDEVVTKSAARGEWPCPPVVALAIKDSEVGPKVAHHLATNREEAIAISRMSPIEQAMAFGRLEAKYLGAPAVQPNIATNAPQPAPARTKGGQFAPSAELDDRLSQDEWLRRRNAQLRA